METTWRPVLLAETEKPYWKPLQQFVRDERSKYKVFPPDKGLRRLAPDAV
jgi:uracil DNA glycosylase